MTELIVTILVALFGSATIGSNIALWLKLSAERQTTRSELERLRLEISARSDLRADDRDDRWREAFIAANAQWQVYTQQQVRELTEGIKQARHDLEQTTRRAAEGATKSMQVITGLEHEVAELKQTLAALRHEIKVLTTQNSQLIERKDVSPAEAQTLADEIEASQTINTEENSNVA